MIDPRLERLVQRQEGIRLDLYRDTRGFWTIGCGHLVSHDPALPEEAARAACGAPWSFERSLRQLHEDLERAERGIDLVFPWAEALPPLVRAGLIDMVFQLGVAGVAGFPRMLAALEAGDWAGAEYHALDSAWRRQTPQRCEEVAAMLGNRKWAKE